MTIAVPEDTAKALTERAQGLKMKPEDLAVTLLRQQLGLGDLETDIDEWEKGLTDLSLDCGVSVDDKALSREGLYD